MNRKQKIIVSVTGIFIILLALIGLTYAYFLTQITDNDAERSIEITTAYLELVYSDNTPEIDLSGITPIYSSEVQSKGLVKSFTISKTAASDNVYAKIKLVNLNVPTVVAKYDLKWALYKGTDPIATGDFGGKTTGEIVIATNQLIDSTTGSTYNLYIWINETGLDQSNMMNQTITAKIDVIGYGKLEETLASKILTSGTKYATNTTFLGCSEGCVNYNGAAYCYYKGYCTGVERTYSSLDNTIYNNPTFTSSSTDRGLFIQSGDVTKSEMGFSTYYYRGQNANNYVSFGKYKTTDGSNNVDNSILWRIVRINEDGSIKLISEDSIGTSAFNSRLSKYINDDETDSIIKTKIETWYNNNIAFSGNNLDNKVIISSFCNDTTGVNYNATTQEEIEYSSGDAYNRLREKAPIFTCPNGAIIANEKVGLITADELMYGGAIQDTTVSNNTTYLEFYKSEFYWTMTPAKIFGLYAFSSGDVLEGGHPANSSGYILRPVINLSPDVIVSGGDGTLQSPYTIQ